MDNIYSGDHCEGSIFNAVFLDDEGTKLAVIDSCNKCNDDKEPMLLKDADAENYIKAKI